MNKVELSRSQRNGTAPSSDTDSGRRHLGGPLGVGTLLTALLFAGERAEAQSAPRGRQDVVAGRRADDRLKAAGEFMTVTDIDVAIRQFRPDVHLYVSKTRGFFPKYPIPESQLKELAQKLASTDYYLFVTADSSGYRFNSLKGPKAVTAKLGRELFNDPRFEAVKSDRLAPGRSSASILAISVEPRDWWFSASRELEEAGISDERDWTGGRGYGDLGKDDFRAGRFVDGVMKTIRAIEHDLGEKVAEVQQQRVDAESSLATATGLLTDYQRRLETTRAEFPGRTGDLFTPTDLPRIQQSITHAEEQLAQRDFSAATAAGKAVQQQLTVRIADLVEYPVAGKQLAGLRAELVGLAKHPFEYALPGMHTSANGVLESAEKAWKEGRGSYRQDLSRAASAVTNLKGALVEAEKTFTVDGEHIRDLIGRAGQLVRSPYAAGLQEPLKAVTGKLVEVQKVWERKDPAYPELLRVADGEVTRLSAQVLQREQLANSWALFKQVVFGSLGLAGLVTLGAGWLQSQRVGRRRGEAQKKLQLVKAGVEAWTTGLHELEGLQGEVLFRGEVPAQFVPGSKSQQHADSAKAGLRRLWLFSSVVFAEIISQAEERIAAGGVIRTGNYDAAIGILTKQKIEFGQDDKAKLEKAQCSRSLSRSWSRCRSQWSR